MLQQKNKIIVGVGNEVYINNIKLLLTPAKTLYPDWYKKLPSNSNNLLDGFDTQEENISSLGTVKTCPSFVNLFRNSYVLKCPTDLVFRLDNGSWRAFTPDASLLDIESHDLYLQLGAEHIADNYINLKFMFNVNVKTSADASELIYFSPLYYKETPFVVIPGTLPLNKNFYNELNLNLLLHKSYLNGKQEIKIEAGTVLAMLYMPGGLLDIEVKKKENKPQTRFKFIGDYYYKIKNKIYEN